MTFATVDAAIEAARAHRNPNGSPKELEAAEAAAKLAPERADVWAMVAGAATRLGDFDRAEAAQLRAMEVATDPLMKDRLAVDRAWALAGQKRWAEAAELARQERPLIANDPMSRNIIGATLVTVGLGAEAVPHLEFAAKGLPDRPDIWFNLAVVYNSLNRVDEAEEALEAILRMAPGYLPAYEFLGELKKATPESNQLDRLNAVRARVRPGPDTAFLDYALFRQYDDLGRTDEAWAALTRASEAKGSLKAWTVAEDEAAAEALKRVASAIPPGAGSAPGEPRPIFIVSLPRVGSTLIERIFAAHPRVRSLGELETFPRMLKTAAGLEPLPFIDARLAEVGPIDYAAVGDRYRKEIKGLADGAEVITDKLPLNWWYAPMIAAALPDATILHVRREPMDSLFGALKISFSAAFAWSYKLDHLADHYGVYRRLTDHWRELLGERFVEVDYEALVSDPEAQTRALLAACGLDFDEACMKPEEAQGAVITPSATQVREPISSRRVGAWRRYAEQLEPLRARLEADGFVDANGDAVAR